MASKYAGKSVDQIMPGNPPSGTSRAEQLMKPNAVEQQDMVTGSNDLKAYVGKSGKPPGPFGQRGRL